MVIIYCLISLICLALAYILIFTSYVDQFRVHQFIKRWNTLIQEGARELQELESRDTYIYESAIQSFKDKYYPVANAAIGFRRPKSPQLISQILDYLTFANKYRTIDSIAINVNSQYFNLSSEELCTDFNKIKTDNRYVGYHEYEEFKEKWSKILYEFNDIKDHSSYSKTIQRYNIFCTVHNIFVNNDFDTTRINNNKLYSKNELINNSNFFDTLFAYPLDKQQREAIVSAEDNTLVVSSAGSGKTSTIVGKVRYLVEQKGVDPNSILVVTYTRKAALELRERMGISGVSASTFHKHALDTIGLLTGSKPTIADSTTMRQIFENTIRNDKAFITHINKYITDLINLSKEDHQYESSKQRAADIQKYGLKVPYNDMDGKSIYVRSKQEYQIAIILTHLGISFRYEAKYPYDTSSISKRQYRPDFVIYYDKVFYDSNGKACIQKAQLYYEHFGIDSHGNVPKWFGEGLEGGWIKAQQDYIAGIHWKRNIHKTLKTTLMETTSADFSNRTENEMESFIESKLRACGVPIKRLSEEDKRKKLLEANSRVDETLYTLINGFITLLKANQRSINELIQNISNKDKHKERNTYILENIIRPIYEKYQATLKSDGIYDYTDILLNAAELCEKQNPFSYEYILVDEFQDISMDKYIYLKSLRKREPYTKLFCVGDDWQSIYRFSGSDMTLFYDFKKFFGYTNECYIETTHRFGEPLLSASSIFILTNPEQKKKEVKTTSELNTTINFMPYSGLGARKDLETIIRQIPSNDSIYILGRYKFNATQIGGRETQYGQTINIAGRDIQYLTIHSSKGLEADHVIILDCDNGTYGFPSLIADDPILEYVLSGTDSFDNSEERRVFYVAVTRARKATYCLFSRETPSPFLSEFGEYCRYSDSTEAVCPRCGRGYVKILKSGKTQRGDAYITVGCSNSGCDYFENLFKDDIFRYQPRSLINRTPLSEYLMKNNLENRYMNFNTRLWWLKENNTGEIFPIVISPNLVASSHLLERIKHSTDDYDICEVKYYDDTICFLTKRTGNIFISNQDLSNYLNLIAGANNTQKYY